MVANTANADLLGGLAESTEALPEVDERAAAIAELEEMCLALVKAAHDMRNELSAAKPNERRLGRLEQFIFMQTDAIHRRQRELYIERGVFVAISHTVDGLPIRVDRHRKVQLWGN